MWAHTTEAHGGVIGPNGGLNDYTMKIASTNKPPLKRILEEGVTVKDLENRSLELCLNSKTEYYKPEFIRTTYTVGAQRDAHQPSWI